MVVGWNGGHTLIVISGFEPIPEPREVRPPGGFGFGEQLDQQRGPRGPKDYCIPRRRPEAMCYYMEKAVLVIVQWPA